MVRAQALKALGLFLSGPPLLEHLLATNHDPSSMVRAEVGPILKRLNPKDLLDHRERLIPLLDRLAPPLDEPVVELLAWLFREDWKRLVDVLLGTEQTSRIVGLITTLGRIRAAEIGPLLLQFLKHPDPEVRAASVQAAVHRGILPRQDLQRFLEDPHEAVRVAVVRAIKQALDPETVALLQRRLQDPSDLVRAAAAQVLGSLNRPIG